MLILLLHPTLFIPYFPSQTNYMHYICITITASHTFPFKWQAHCVKIKFKKNTHTQQQHLHLEYFDARISNLSNQCKTYNQISFAKKAHLNSFIRHCLCNHGPTKEKKKTKQNREENIKRNVVCCCNGMSPVSHEPRVLHFITNCDTSLRLHQSGYECLQHVYSYAVQ